MSKISILIEKKYCADTLISAISIVSPAAPSGDDPSLSLEQERYQLGVKVLDMDHAPLSQVPCCRTLPIMCK